MGDSHNNSIAVGIDLGTSKACVAYYKHGITKIVKNKDGSRLIPTSLDNGEPEFGIKHLICNLSSSDKGLELCVNFFKNVKNNTEFFLSTSVDRVVIALPRYFNDKQRYNLLTSAYSAGLRVLFVSEAEAAATAFHFSSGKDANYSLIFDFGVGNCSATVCQKTGASLEVISNHADTKLGGRCFDEVIKKYVCDMILNKHGSFPEFNRIASRKLENKCEQLKKILSHKNEAVLAFDEFAHFGDIYEIKLSRKKFEQISDLLFQRALAVLDQCMKNSKLSKRCIENIILAGGSSRIPKIQDMISHYFNGKTFDRFMNPEECVAEGAAVVAANSWFTNKSE